jgi:hypothetical protein
MGNWKYIDEDEEYYGWKAEVSQLYNISKDPGETTNLLDKHPERVKEFEARMQYWEQQVRPSEAHEPIPDFPPIILGEGEDELIPPSLIEKLKKNQARKKNKKIRLSY